MKLIQWPVRVIFFVGLLQIVACTKSIDTPATDSINLESSSDATVANEFSNCKLRRILHENPFVSESTVNCLFTYNAAGNPHSLIHTGPLVIPTSGYPTENYYFYYDKKNRLYELLVSFGEDFYSETTILHRYGYDANDVIVMDTILHPNYETGQVGRETFIPSRTIALTYDSQGRIVKETIKNLSTGTTRNPTYTYDSRGNLAVPGWKSSGYDNKVSIFRAHPIFQFIHRNYSRNNALPEAKYNSRGLPLAVRNLNDDFFGAYRINPFAAPNPLGGVIRAVYDCE